MPPPDSQDSSETPLQQDVPLSTIFWVFFQIGSLSVGGGLIAWLHREIVQKRRLLTEADFMGAVTLAQVLPGINVTNLSIYVGQRLRGVSGSLAALGGLLLVPFFAILAIGSVYAQIKDQPVLHHFLDGMAATAVGLLLAMGVKSMQVTRMARTQLAIAASIVFLVGVLRLSMVPVILVITPLSIWLVWPKSDEEDGSAEDGPNA